MPKAALADTVYDWKQLLLAAAEHANKKELKIHLKKLAKAAKRFEELEALREELRARRQEATQELEEVKQDGKEAAIEVRSILRGIFGHTSERLGQFNMRPRRNSRRKTASPASE
jgi:CHASE3 domain sensor protein